MLHLYNCMKKESKRQSRSSSMFVEIYVLQNLSLTVIIVLLSFLTRDFQRNAVFLRQRIQNHLQVSNFKDLLSSILLLV